MQCKPYVFAFIACATDNTCSVQFSVPIEYKLTQVSTLLTLFFMHIKNIILFYKLEIGRLYALVDSSRWAPGSHPMFTRILLLLFRLCLHALM
jgi:hypothetical protein